MIALIPRAEDATTLAVSGGDKPEEIHLTLTYLGDDISGWSSVQRAQAVSAAASAAAQLAPVAASVMGHSVFNPNGDRDQEACTVYVVSDSAVLAPLRNALTVFADSEQYEPFIPHITAGYGIPFTRLTYTGPITFDRLRIQLAEQTMDFPLGDPEEIKKLMDAIELKGKMPANLADRFAKKKPNGQADDKGGTADAGINNIGDLAKAVKAYKKMKESLEKVARKKVIKAAATKLKSPKMVAGLDEKALDNGSEAKMFEAVALEFKVTSEDPRAVKLRRWWATNPEGTRMWKPGTPGDFLRLVKALAAHTRIKSKRVLKGLAANIHHLALGVWPGREGRKAAFDWLDLEFKTRLTDLEAKSHGAELGTDGVDLFKQYKEMRAALTAGLEDEDDDEKPDPDDNTGDDLSDASEDEMSEEAAYAEGLANDIDWSIDGDGTLEDSAEDELDSPEELGESPEESENPDDIVEEDEIEEDTEALAEVDDIFDLLGDAKRPPLKIIL